MKIGILTFHRAYNYGAVLQAFALSETLKTLGYEVEIIDYWPDYFRKQYYLVPQKAHSLKDFKKQLKRVVGKVFLKRTLNERNKNFEDFIDTYLLNSRDKFRTYKDVEKALSKYDVVITGSDQVWNNRCANFDKVFFLDFNIPVRKYSYAASFGFDRIPNEFKEEYKKRLSGFEGYSVRENTGVQILSDLIGVDSTLCCDPTLLMNSKMWRSTLEIEQGEEDYILVYYVTKADTVRKEAQKISREKNCRVISIPCQVAFPELYAEKDRKAGFEVVNSCSPKQFVEYFAHAKYVITNSFHGTVFSLIFHKKMKTQFVQDTGKTNNRVIGLMKNVGLENRDIKETKVNIDEEIPWTEVDRKIETIKQNSMLYLKSIND